ncbi:hypothetical protein NIA69_07380 [Gemmiger formicilis]|nr:hypothetical protein [Gemmiger formicilis]
MNKGLKNKGLGSWFCLAAALVALITGIVFLLTQATAALWVTPARWPAWCCWSVLPLRSFSSLFPFRSAR